MRGTLFTTRRLLVRYLTSADLPVMEEIYGDAQDMRWVGDGQPLDRSACERWLEITRRNYVERGYGLFAVENKVSGEPVGFCGIVHPAGQPEPEIKYAVRRMCRGQGLAREAAAGLLDHAGKRFGLTHIIATVAPDNLASVTILKKLGMQLVRSYTDSLGYPTDLYQWQTDPTTLPEKNIEQPATDDQD